MASVHSSNSTRTANPAGVSVQHSYVYLRQHEAPAEQLLAAAVREDRSFGVATLRKVFGLAVKPGAAPRNFYRGQPCYSPTDCEPIPEGVLSYDDLVAQGITDKKVLLAQALAENKLLGKRRLANELGLKPPAKCIPALVTAGVHLYRVSQCLPEDQVSERTRLQDELAMLHEQSRKFPVPVEILELVNGNGVLIHARGTDKNKRSITCFDLHGNTLIEGEIALRSTEDLDALAAALNDHICIAHAESASDQFPGSLAQNLRARGIRLQPYTLQSILATELTRDAGWTDPIKLCAKITGIPLKAIEAELPMAGDPRQLSRIATLRAISLLMTTYTARQDRIKEIEKVLITPQDATPQEGAAAEVPPPNPVEQARAEEREACARSLEMTNAELLLMAGEMTAQELRTVQAVLKAKAAMIRRNTHVR